ncbi:MAG: hypothetical protein O2849_07105 [Proteobacteria bacterium]|nr:hypothetical protein [Pseudomonadota bacterium]
MKLYRERKGIALLTIRGLLLAYVGADNMLSGPFRDLLTKYFKLGEFGSNTREEYLYYFIFGLGVLQLLVTFQSLFIPLVELDEQKIIIRTRENTFSIVKDRSEVKSIEILDEDNLEFSFVDKKYIVPITAIPIEDVHKLISLLEEE